MEKDWSIRKKPSDESIKGKKDHPRKSSVGKNALVAVLSLIIVGLVAWIVFFNSIFGSPAVQLPGSCLFQPSRSCKI